MADSPTNGALLPQHQALLDASAINAQVAAERGYRSITDPAELAALGYAEYQRLVPCLFIPILDARGETVLHHIRPDTPRIDKDTGKLRKYEFPFGIKMRLDIPRAVAPVLGDPSQTLVVTEGIRKVDSAISQGLCAIAILGTWCWRGTNGQGGKCALPDWDEIALNERKIALAFDSDFQRNPHVYDALARLKKFLEHRGAKVTVIRLPDGPPDAEGKPTKLGLDDYFGKGSTIDDLKAFVRKGLGERPKKPAKEPKPNPRRAEPGQGGAGQDPSDYRENLTDLGNAQRLVRRHLLDIRFCHPWQRWLVWDGARWAQDDTAQVLRFARGVVSSLYDEVAALREKARSANDSSTREELTGRAEAIENHALASEANYRIRAMAALAESEPVVPVVPDQLDRATWLLNTPTKTVDLRNGRGRDNEREDLITKVAGAAYDPAAKCPRFEKFALEIMGWCEDASEDEKRRAATLAAFLQRVFGYAATGECSERRLFVLWGSGKNGKSLLLNIISEALGDYAKKMAVSSLLVKKGDTIPNDIAALKGARLVFAAESAEGKKLDESLVKELTGREPISARFMRAEWFSFVPTFVPLLATNHKPIISGTDQAIWDRVCLIPFTRRFDGEGEDKDLVHTLRGELPGILLWIVRGAIEWQRHGLGEPEEVRAATAGYREESDRLAEFIAEECIEGPAFRVAMADLYKAYRSWGESRGEFPMGPRTFGERLRERGVQPAKGTGGKRMWLGIGVLRPQGASGRNGTGCRDPGEEADLP